MPRDSGKKGMYKAVPRAATKKLYKDIYSEILEINQNGILKSIQITNGWQEKQIMQTNKIKWQTYP